MIIAKRENHTRDKHKQEERVSQSKKILSYIKQAI